MRILVIAFALVVMPLSSTAGAAGSLTREEIKELVLQTIRENPEIIAEAISLLQQQEENARLAAAAAALEGVRDSIENDPNAPVLGNPDGDVTVVEFFDYNCPYCKRAADSVAALVAEDEGVRLVYREWPILSEGSLFAARAALAARQQDRYEEMHVGLMALPRAEESTVLQVARDLGLDVTQLTADMNAPEIDEHIDLSMHLADTLQFNGTPSFVIGNALVPGLVSLEHLRSLVDQARADADADSRAD